MNEPPESAPVYLIIGAGGGIGSEVCRKLSADGARLALAGRTAEPLDALRDSLETPSASFECDARDFEQVDDLFARVFDRYGRIDGVANMAGSILLKPAHLTSADEWRDTIATNLTSAFAIVRAAGRHMRENDGSGGSVVLMSTCAARIGLSNHEAIAAAKAGVIGLTQAAAASYSGNNLRFNCVAPGLVETPLSRKITGSPAALEASVALHPLGRIGTPEDIAPAVVWLLSSTSAFVTGQTIGVDGGLATIKTRR